MTTMPFNTITTRKHWLRIPFLLFTGLFVFEYSLETYYSEATADGVLKLSTASREFPPTNLWGELGLETCRFPDFYTPSRHAYNLNQEIWVESGWKRREQLKADSYYYNERNVADNTHEYYQMMLRKKQARYNFTSLEIQRNISFIHIGKAGGSSIGCHLAESRKYVRKHCDDALLRRPVPLSALSLHVNCFNHMSGHQYCFDVNDAFLVNARHPIKRMASWFLYEHPQNHRVNYADRDYHCGDLMLFSCYPTFDSLTTIGLAGMPPPKDQRLRLGPNLTQEECSHWAWAAIQGNIPATYHNFYNYDWYTHRLFSMNNDSNNADNGTASDTSVPKEIFVLRAEHLEHDWGTIEGILGGAAYNSTPSTLQSRQNSAKQKILPISNNTARAVGIRNLCRALCEEIQIYKKLLKQAVNLQAEDVESSLQDLRIVCPVETALVTSRQCLRR